MQISPLPWQLHLLIISDSPSFVSQTHLRQKKEGEEKKKRGKTQQVKASWRCGWGKGEGIRSRRKRKVPGDSSEYVNFLDFLCLLIPLCVNN